MLGTQHSELQKLLLGPHQVADTLSAFAFLTFIHIIRLLVSGCVVANLYLIQCTFHF